MEKPSKYSIERAKLEKQVVRLRDKWLKAEHTAQCKRSVARAAQDRAERATELASKLETELFALQQKLRFF